MTKAIDECSPENRRFVAILKRAAAEWMQDNATRLAAALAFYTMLSIAPLLIIAIKIIGVIFGKDAATSGIQSYIKQMMGDKAAEAVNDMIAHAGQPGAGVFATVISVVVLLFSASGVFGELQDSLNTVWEVKPRPDRGIVDIVRERFFSLALVVGTAFLLLVSLVISTAIAAVTTAIGSGHQGVLWTSLNFAVSLVVVTLVFAAILKYLPDVNVRWRNIWIGALITGGLFSVGKLLLGWYLGRATTTSVYGAAGSLVALVLWVYYSAQILFFGAEVTQAYARCDNDGKPAENAVPLTAKDRAQRGIPKREALKAAAAAHSRSKFPEIIPEPAKPVALAAGGVVLGALAGSLTRRPVKSAVAGTRRDLRVAGIHQRLQHIERRLEEISRVPSSEISRGLIHERLGFSERRIGAQAQANPAAPRPATRGWLGRFAQSFQGAYRR